MATAADGAALQESHEHIQGPGRSTEPIVIAVSGLKGPLCSAHARAEWTIWEVQLALSEKLHVPISQQRLLWGTESLGQEVLVGSLTDATSLSLTLVICQVLSGKVCFGNCSGGLQEARPGHLRKTGRVGGWDATAVSTEGFRAGEGFGFQFRPGHLDKEFVLGLGFERLAPPDYRSIDFAAYCGRDGRFAVREKGVLTFECLRKYSLASFLAIHVNYKLGQIEYFLDGRCEHISPFKARSQLFILASFLTPGAEAVEIQWLHEELSEVL